MALTTPSIQLWSQYAEPIDREIALADEVYHLLLERRMEEADARSALAAITEHSQTPHEYGRMCAWLRLFDASASVADAVVALMYARWTEDECGALPRAQEMGAPLWELWALGLSGLTCSGQDLQSISTATLVERMKAVQQRMATGAPSRWLTGYSRMLIRESRRRKGIGRQAH